MSIEINALYFSNYNSAQVTPKQETHMSLKELTVCNRRCKYTGELKITLSKGQGKTGV